MEALRDPQLVWRVQRYFGIRKVGEVRGGGEEEPWVAVEATEKKAGMEEKSKSSNGGANILYYKVTDQFWHLVFLLGSQLGDEELLGLYFMVWMWCLDSMVGRRVVLTWTLVMYIGQGMKDIIRWPRPKMPPVVQLEKKWSLEYGMPSTHAMVSLAVPAASLFFTVGRYDYHVLPWVVGAVCWCLLVSVSRVYLGMHSVADVLAGLAITPPLLLLILPLVEHTDHWLVTSSWSPLLSLSLSLLAVYFYPGSDRWTPARGDTTASLGTYIGCLFAHWLTFHQGLMCTRPGQLPHPILWPSATPVALSYRTATLLVLRIAIGFLVFLVTRALGKPLVYSAACKVLKRDPAKLQAQERDVTNRDKLLAELTHKYLTYLACGFNAILVVPAILWLLGVGRLGCWTDW